MQYVGFGENLFPDLHSMKIYVCAWDGCVGKKYDERQTIGVIKYFEVGLKFWDYCRLLFPTAVLL